MTVVVGRICPFCRLDAWPSHYYSYYNGKRLLVCQRDEVGD